MGLLESGIALVETDQVTSSDNYIRNQLISQFSRDSGNQISIIITLSGIVAHFAG